MDINIIGLLRSRGLALVTAIALSLSGLALLVADAIAENQSMMLGGLALLFFGVAVYFVGVIRGPDDRSDFWESVAWGKLFVGMVYASIAILFLLVLLHAPAVMHTVL